MCFLAKVSHTRQTLSDTDDTRSMTDAGGSWWGSGHCGTAATSVAAEQKHVGPRTAHQAAPQAADVNYRRPQASVFQQGKHPISCDEAPAQPSKCLDPRSCEQYEGIILGAFVALNQASYLSL